MTYQNTTELPKRVKDKLPGGAQEIYMSAFNSAIRIYTTPKSLPVEASLEETAGKVAWSAVNAWSAVKKECEKSSDGKWHVRNKGQLGVTI